MKYDISLPRNQVSTSTIYSLTRSLNLGFEPMTNSLLLMSLPTFLIADCAAPIVSDEDKLVPAQMLGQIGHVVGQLVDGVEALTLWLVALPIAAVVHRHTPDEVSQTRLGDILL